METLAELMKTYKDVGVAGLFLAENLILLYFFYKELKSSKAETVAMIERVVSALDTSSSASENNADVLKSVGVSLDTNTKQTGEFIAFVRGRDAGRGGDR